ncbi:MAG TPA: P1 family peptidase [Candidatus Sulfomarinibacteraceae bacterium]|nr:P1 family peptidase [Candidatus Sulfomarinibacteraceae bacterium]
MELCGLKIGHATDEDALTGCTVILCPDNTVGSVDVRGPAPGSRESALLAMDKPVEYVNAVVFSGGSAFGLATADGVMRFLAEKGIGHMTPIRPVPIVPAAIVYDLFLGGGQSLPDAEMGYQACLAATDDDITQGNVGAGAGVTVGKWSGPQAMMKGGFGLASRTVDGVSVCAAVVTNSIGDVVNDDGSVLAGARGNDGSWAVERDPYRRFPAGPPVNPGTNTTLVAVATNAPLNKIGANRLAQRAHDGLAISIRPVHTTHDGDTVFALATGTRPQAPFDFVANVAVEVVVEAVRNAVRHADTVAGVPGLGGEPGA